MSRSVSERPRCIVRYKEKENCKGKGTLYLRLCFQGRSTQKSLCIDINEEDWDNKNRCIRNTLKKKNERLFNEYNYTIESEIIRVQQQFNKYDEKLTFEIVKQMLHGDFISKDKKKKELDFIEHCKHVLELKKIQGGSPKTYYNKIKLIETFQNFFISKYKREHISISEVTPGLFDEYIKWRIEREPKNKLVTTTKSLVPLVQGVESLHEEGIIESSIYSSIKKKYLKEGRPTYTSKPQKKSVKYLTPEQIEKFLELYKKENRQTTIQYMEMFLFSMYTGLRSSDIITLEWDNIDLKNQKICKIMIKTGEVLDEYLSDDSIKILKKWKNRNSRFVFNLLNEDFNMNDTENLWRVIDSKNRSIRQSLNIIGERMKLPFNLGLHCGRHTFTVLCINLGEDIYSVSKSLGHTSIKSTERTYSDILDSRKKLISQKRNFGFSLPIT